MGLAPRFCCMCGHYFFKQTILESLVLIKNLMRLIKESQTQNYERPQIIEIDLIPQGVLCGSGEVTVTIGGEQPDSEE